MKLTFCVSQSSSTLTTHLSPSTSRKEGFCWLRISDISKGPCFRTHGKAEYHGMDYVVDHELLTSWWLGLKNRGKGPECQYYVFNGTTLIAWPPPFLTSRPCLRRAPPSPAVPKAGEQALGTQAFGKHSWFKLQGQDYRQRQTQSERINVKKNEAGYGGKE